MTKRPSSVRRSIDARLGLRASHEPSETAWVVRLPGVIAWLVAGMLLVLVLSNLPGWRAARLDYVLGFVPARFLAGLGAEGLYRASPLSGVGPIITHQFLHGGFVHLGVNTVGLVLFGTGVARRFGADGTVGAAAGAVNRAVFASFFLTCGVVGALAYVLLEPSSARPLIGASGAVSGLMGGAMRFALRRFAPYGVAEGPLASPLSLPIMVVTATFLATNLATAVGIPMPLLPGGDIGWHAHIGGYLFGLLAFPYFDRLTTRPAGARYA